MPECGQSIDRDCSSNGIPDECDVDCNDNGLPDTCECFAADYDRDGDTDLEDFAAFQLCYCGVIATGVILTLDCDCAFDFEKDVGWTGRHLSNRMCIALDTVAERANDATETGLRTMLGNPRVGAWEYPSEGERRA